MSPEEIIAKIRILEERLYLKYEDWMEAKAVSDKKRVEWDQVRLLIKSATQLLEKGSSYQVGDKVMVSRAFLIGHPHEQNWQDIEGIVSKVHCRLRKDNTVVYEYCVNKIKKDGSMSQMAIRSKYEDYPASQLTLIK